MTFKKLVRRLDKLVVKRQLPEPTVSRTPTETRIQIDSRTRESRAAFRTLRDQFQGRVAADITHVYGLLGDIDVTVVADEVLVVCRDERGKVYASHRLTEETLA